MVGEVLANCSMWSTLAHQLQSTCHVMSVAELEGVTGMRLIGGNVMSRVRGGPLLPMRCKRGVWGCGGVGVCVMCVLDGLQCAYIVLMMKAAPAI